MSSDQASFCLVSVLASEQPQSQVITVHELGRQSARQLSNCGTCSKCEDGRHCTCSARFRLNSTHSSGMTMVINHRLPLMKLSHQHRNPASVTVAIVFTRTSLSSIRNQPKAFKFAIRRHGAISPKLVRARDFVSCLFEAGTVQVGMAHGPFDFVSFNDNIEYFALFRLPPPGACFRQLMRY